MVPPQVPPDRANGAATVGRATGNRRLVLVMVNVMAAPVVPAVWAPKASVAGATVTVIAELVPVRPTGEPVTPTLAAMASVPVVVPGRIGAAKRTLIVQVVAAANVAPQLPPPPPPGREKAVVENVRAMPVAPA